jgi:hypothetical protein
MIDIKTGIFVSFLLTCLASVLCLSAGIRSIQAGNKLMYYRKRRDLISRGWRFVFFCIVFAGLAVFLYGPAEQIVINVTGFVPSPTITLTPTLTLTPTITVTSTISVTPTVTETSRYSPTPFIPETVIVQFTSVVTPNPEAVFSPVVFAQSIDKKLQPVKPAVEFANPVGHLYGTFSYNNMVPGSQWTAIWLRDGQLVYAESKPWDGGNGGYGYTDWNPTADAWLPGNYEVQIFVGLQFKLSNRFTVTGDAPTPIPTVTLTPTITLTPSPTVTRTPTGTRTRIPTQTPKP